MPDPAERPYTAGEPVIWTDRTGDMPTKRGCEFQGLDTGGHSATVKWGGQSFVVPVDSLSRSAPPQPPNFLPDGWFQVKQPPKPPSSEDLAATLSERRQALSRAQDRAKEAGEQQAAARLVSQRADQAVIDARSTLSALDAADRQQQENLELAIALGKPLPARSNGHDRQYIVDRVGAAEAAQQRFDRELAQSTAALADALAGVRKAAGDVIGALLERETENLRAAEARAAVLRAELVAVSGWWPSAEIGVLKVSPATAGCLEAPVAWQDEPRVRAGGGWIKQWQQVFDRLCQGDTASDFSLSSGD